MRKRPRARLCGVRGEEERQIFVRVAAASGLGSLKGLALPLGCTGSYCWHLAGHNMGQCSGPKGICRE